MTQKKFLVVFPARNGFFIRRGDNAKEALDGDEQYVAKTPLEVADIVREHCHAFEDTMSEGAFCSEASEQGKPSFSPGLDGGE